MLLNSTESKLDFIHFKTCEVRIRRIYRHFLHLTSNVLSKFRDRFRAYFTEVYEQMDKVQLKTKILADDRQDFCF